jgi:hypothetical protein
MSNLDEYDDTARFQAVFEEIYSDLARRPPIVRDMAACGFTSDACASRSGLLHPFTCQTPEAQA